MATALGLSAWLAHPRLGDLLRFNLLVSQALDPARALNLWPASMQGLLADPQTRAAVHRHGSGHLIESLGLMPAWDDEPALPLACAPAAIFAELRLRCGLVVLGRSLRQTIAGADVRMLIAALGAERLAFARLQARAMWDGDSPEPLAPSRAGEQASGWGAALLWQAFDAASQAVGRRGQLRLPESCARLALPDGLATPAAAMPLALRVLEQVDSAWLSSFPARR